MKREPKWTRQEKRWLSGLIRAGLSLAQIAAKLERSEGSVRSMAGKLGHYPEDWAGDPKTPGRRRERAR